MPRSSFVNSIPQNRVSYPDELCFEVIVNIVRATRSPRPIKAEEA